MFRRKKYLILACVLYLLSCTFYFSAITLAQDEKVVERYKLMLNRNPKEGSTFDRLYQLYLEDAGLDTMVADYQAAAEAKPNDSNLQLILGHIHKRLGKDAETLAAYQRAVELAPNSYYPHFALGQMYATLRRHADAISRIDESRRIIRSNTGRISGRIDDNLQSTRTRLFQPRPHRRSNFGMDKNL